MKTNNFDIDISICKKLFWALILLASGIDALGMLTIAYTIVGWSLIVTSIAYMINIAIMVSMIKSRG